VAGRGRKLGLVQKKAKYHPGEDDSMPNAVKEGEKDLQFTASKERLNLPVGAFGSSYGICKWRTVEPRG